MARARSLVAGIMTLSEIKEEILPALTPRKKLELAELLEAERAVIAATEGIDEAEEERWDEQLREDFRTGGPMSQSAARAREEHRAGKTLPDWP